MVVFVLLRPDLILVWLGWWLARCLHKVKMYDMTVENSIFWEADTSSRRRSSCLDVELAKHLVVSRRVYMLTDPPFQVDLNGGEDSE